MNVLRELAPDVSESALRASRSPSLLSVKTQVFSSCILCGRAFVSEFVWQWYSHTTEGNFDLSCCAMSFSAHLISWGKWMFCENCACTRDLWVSYCVAQSCRVCVACSSCTVIIFVFFFMIMIREYCACFILHSAWRWAHISKTSLN